MELIDFELPKELICAHPKDAVKDPQLIWLHQVTGQITRHPFAELSEILGDQLCYANNAKTDYRCTYLEQQECVYASETLNGMGTFAVPSAGLPIQSEMALDLNLRFLQLFTPEKRNIEYPDMIRNNRSWMEFYRVPIPPEYPVLAIGSTTVKALESYAITKEERGQSDLLILPGHRFQLIKGMLTSFHYPKGPLVMMVAAFIGMEPCKDLYQYALKSKLRFVEFGDRLLVL